MGNILHPAGERAKGIEPFHDNVLIIRDENDEKVRGIIMPAGSQEKPCRGTVVAIGPGKIDVDTGEAKTSKHWAKVGDHVLFTKYGGADVTHCGQDFIMVSQEHLLARIPID